MKSASLLIGALAMALMCGSQSSYARVNIGSVYVYSEKDSDTDRQCLFRNESAVAAVEAALRQNSIQIANKSDRYKVLSVYLNTNTFDVVRNDCAVSLDIQFKVHQLSAFPGFSKPLWSEVVFCTRGSSGYLRKSTVQSDVNNSYKNMVDECISEIEKLDQN